MDCGTIAVSLAKKLSVIMKLLDIYYSAVFKDYKFLL